MKNILIITQKVNADDDLLGFFVDWLKEFSKNFNQVYVITLEKGNYTLPDNVSVYSLGKEKNNSKIVCVYNFYKLLFKLVPKSDGIFAHMSPVFAVASWPVAVAYRKKIILWYLHRSVTPRLRLAEKLCYKIVTASKESLKFKSSKIVEIGHGIDVERFKAVRNWQDAKLEILSVGRISRIKDYETLLKAAKILKDKAIDFKIKIIGQPIMTPDFEYQKLLLSLKEELGLCDVVEFLGLVPYSHIANYYKKADIVVGLTPHGGIDKAILEGMASGCLPLTSNEANGKYFNQKIRDVYIPIFGYGNPDELAARIITLASLPVDVKKMLSNFMVESVSIYHDLSRTIQKISVMFNKENGLS